MITVITGQPGAGKTLYTLQMVTEWAEREKRSVYFSGIKDLRLPWAELEDGAEWYKLPSGSIVVVDEAQRIFRPRGTGGQVPVHVAELETHRHKGLDLVLVTQHPKLLDANVRRLGGRHLHVVRTFGMQRATIHEWGEVRDECDKSREDSIRHEWTYPAAMFAAYQSAEVHTHKRRVPARLWLLLLAPILIALCVWWVVRWWETAGKPKVGAGAKADSGKIVSAPLSESGKLSPAAYVAQHQPRVAGLAYTAPVYDDVVRPVRAPYPAACVANKSRCQCYSEQGTRLDMPPELCRSMVEKGFYVAWDAVGQSFEGSRSRAARPETAERAVEAGKADNVWSSATASNATNPIPQGDARGGPSLPRGAP